MFQCTQYTHTHSVYQFSCSLNYGQFTITIKCVISAYFACVPSWQFNNFLICSYLLLAAFGCIDSLLIPTELIREVIFAYLLFRIEHPEEGCFPLFASIREKKFLFPSLPVRFVLHLLSILNKIHYSSNLSMWIKHTWIPGTNNAQKHMMPLQITGVDIIFVLIFRAWKCFFFTLIVHARATKNFTAFANVYVFAITSCSNSSNCTVCVLSVCVVTEIRVVVHVIPNQNMHNGKAVVLW